MHTFPARLNNGGLGFGALGFGDLIRVIVINCLTSCGGVGRCRSGGGLGSARGDQAVESFHDGGHEAGGEGDEARESAVLEVLLQVELHPGGFGEQEGDEDDGEVDRVAQHCHELVEAEHDHGGDGPGRGHPGAAAPLGFLRGERLADGILRLGSELTPQGAALRGREQSVLGGDARPCGGRQGAGGLRSAAHGARILVHERE